MTDIKLGLIGCGWIIQKAHIPSFQKIAGVNIWAVFDVNKDNALTISKKYSIKHVFNNIDHFFSSGIDAVIIATPNFTHKEYTIRALEKGIHVLCEKPVALLEKDIVEIIKLAKEKNVIYMPGFVNRFRQDIRKAYQLIKESYIGNVLKVEGNWIRKAGIPKIGGWFTNKELAGGGVLVDLGSHVIDLCTMFLPEENIMDISLLTKRNYEKILDGSAKWFQEKNEKEKIPIDVELAACGYVLYKSSKSIKVNLSWAEDIENDYTYIVISGEKGTIEIKTLFGFSNQRLWQEDELIVQVNGEIVNKIYFDKTQNNSMQAFFDMNYYFVKMIRTNNENYLVAEDAIRSVSLIEKLYKKEKVVDKLSDEFLIGGKT